MNAATIDGSKPAQFTYPIAQSGDKNTIQAATSTTAVSQANGFPSVYSTPRSSGGKSVARKDMNALFNMCSSLNYYFQYMGRNPWISGTAYPKGALVWVYNATDGGGEYVCKTDGATSTTSPASDTTNWVKVGSATGLVLDSTSVGAVVTKSYIEEKLGYSISIVSAMPSSPVSGTIYFVTES